MRQDCPSADVVMLGTFSAWNLGTIQARAMPLAAALRRQGIQTAIVTTPWDLTTEAGTVDVIDQVPVINTTSTSPRRPVAAVREQMDWVRRLSPQLVHVFKPKGFGGLTGRALCRTLPVLVDSDDWEGDGGWNDLAGYSFPQRRVFHFQETDLLRRANHVTAASTLLAQRARRLRPDDAGESVHRIENGLSGEWACQLSAARQQPPSHMDPPVVLLYSRFAEFKQDWLARFASQLSRLCTSPVEVRVVGDASSQDLPILGIGTVQINLMGYVALGSIPEILGSTTMAVYPYSDSLVTRSKQSVKLLEQMAAGCPVVASDVGDIVGTLGPAGAVLPDDSPESFAAEVVRLLGQPERLDEMSEQGMTRVITQFGFDVLGQRLLDVYRAAGLR